MQQTNQYKLNLIESGDTFSAAPLNENVEKIEQALVAQEQAVSDLQTQHTQDIAVLTDSAVKIAAGSYVGTNTSGSSAKNKLTFNFVPKLVFVVGDSYYSFFVHGAKYGLGGVCGNSTTNRYVQTATWKDNSLSWYCSSAYSNSGSGSVTSVTQLNSNSITYFYIAIG